MVEAVKNAINNKVEEERMKSALMEFREAGEDNKEARGAYLEACEFFKIKKYWNVTNDGLPDDEYLTLIGWTMKDPDEIDFKNYHTMISKEWNGTRKERLAKLAKEIDFSPALNPLFQLRRLEDHTYVYDYVPVMTDYLSQGRTQYGRNLGYEQAVEVIRDPKKQNAFVRTDGKYNKVVRGEKCKRSMMGSNCERGYTCKNNKCVSTSQRVGGRRRRRKSRKSRRRKSRRKSKKRKSRRRGIFLRRRR